MCTDVLRRKDMKIKLIIELVKVMLPVMWFLLILVMVILFYRPFRDQLLPNLASLKAMGVELCFVRDYIDAAIKMAEKHPQWKVDVPQKEQDRALNRAKAHLKVLSSAQILWVDDQPENNINERRMFRQLKAEVDIAQGTEEALRMLEVARYDLVISDMSRSSESTAGLGFLSELRRQDKDTPVVFYIGEFESEKGTPPQSFGITNRPDELLHLTLDALERKRG